MVLNQKDDNAIPISTVFIFVPNIPIVINQNIHQGLKLVNGANYTTVDIVFNRIYPSYRINADTILYFGPPADILLTLETTKDLYFVGISPDTILLTLINTPIPY